VKAFAMLSFLAAVASGTAADADGLPRWGLSIWGLTYHTNRGIRYNDANVGLGLRYYFNHMFFVEGDALRNSNRGIVVPVSAGAEIRVASIQACRVDAIAAMTVAYYQNLRTRNDYVLAGPVPGVALTCGRVKTNVIVILSPHGQFVAAVTASLTILF
jgi:hypothetical protein